jgi:hypothetical protein
MCLVSFAAFGQQDQLNAFIRQINDWQKALPAVKLHLFFHQPQYAPGDTAYFRAALVAASQSLPLKGSQVAALDLVNAAGDVILHQEFRIRDGWSGNQIIIPADVDPGLYRVVAYTDWMRNFGAHTFFQGDLPIAGPHQFRRIESSRAVALFPEGGKLVEGVRNKVVVSGLSSAQRGVVLDSLQQSITEFTLNDKGYGFFFITPASGEHYTVQAGQGQFMLGPAERDGVSVLLFPAAVKGPSHRFVLQVPPHSALRNQSLYFIISGHGEVFFSTIVRFGQQEFVALSVPTNILPDGIVRASIIRDDGIELASRLLLTRNAVPDARIVLSDTVAGTRSKITLRMSLHDDSVTPAQARLSVSVYNQSVFDPPTGQPGIAQYLLTNSDVHGLNLPGEVPASTTDLTLITATWPWYEWNDLQKKSAPRYYPRNYSVLQGRILNPDNSKPLLDSVMLTLYLQRASDTYQVETSPRGEFVAAPLFDFPAREELMYIAEKAGRPVPVKLELMQDPVHHQPPVEVGVTNVESAYFRYSQLRAQVKKSFGYYRTTAGTRSSTKTSSNAAIEDLLIGADLSFTLSDYTLFPSMQETLHEIIPYLQHRKIRGSDVVRMYLPDVEKTGDGPPAFIIDGILTLDYQYFLNLKPSSVETIKLVYSQHKRTKLGAFGHNGIVLVETKLADNERYVPRSSSVPVQGLTPPQKFDTYEMQWEKENSNSPRLRPVLYWNPLLQLDEKGSVNIDFVSGDDAGEHVIVMEGLTYDGVPFRTEKKFIVRYQPENR